MARYVRRRASARPSSRRSYAAPRRRSSVSRRSVARRPARRTASGRTQTVRIVVQQPAAAGAPLMLGQTLAAPSGNGRSRF